MRYTHLNLLNRDVSVIALGTAAFGTTLSEADSFAQLDAFCAMGGNFIDTARVYGDIGRAEEVVGKWFAARNNRESIILSTKGAHPPHSDLHAGRVTPEAILSDFADSLAALKTDYVDIYFLHRDDRSQPVSGIMQALNELTSAGKVRTLGASNWAPDRILEANAFCRAKGLTGFTISQPQWSLARQINKEDDTLVQMGKQMYAYHRSSGMPLMAYTSLAKGFYTKLNRGGLAALDDKARRRYESENNLRIYGRLMQLSQLLNMDMTQLALSYLTCQPFTAVPIIACSNMDQVEALKKAGDAQLPIKYVQELNALCGF